MKNTYEFSYTIHDVVIRKEDVCKKLGTCWNPSDVYDVYDQETQWCIQSHESYEKIKEKLFKIFDELNPQHKEMSLHLSMVYTDRGDYEYDGKEWKPLGISGVLRRLMQ